MTEATAMITNEDRDDHGQQGMIVGREGDESELGGVIPKNMIEIHRGNPLLPREKQYKLVPLRDVEIHEI